MLANKREEEANVACLHKLRIFINVWDIPSRFLITTLLRVWIIKEWKLLLHTGSLYVYVCTVDKFSSISSFIPFI